MLNQRISFQSRILETLQTNSYLEVAAGAEAMTLSESLKGHSAMSPFRGVRALLRKGVRCVGSGVKKGTSCEKRAKFDVEGIDRGG